MPLQQREHCHGRATSQIRELTGENVSNELGRHPGGSEEDTSASADKRMDAIPVKESLFQ